MGSGWQRAGVRDSLMRRCPLQNSPNSRRAYRGGTGSRSACGPGTRAQVCTLLTLSGILVFG